MSQSYKMKGRTKVFSREEGRAIYTEVVVPIDLEVDWQLLADWFARKLVKSKTGKSRILNGVISAKKRKA